MFTQNDESLLYVLVTKIISAFGFFFVMPCMSKVGIVFRNMELMFQLDKKRPRFIMLARRSKVLASDVEFRHFIRSFPIKNVCAFLKRPAGRSSVGRPKYRRREEVAKDFTAHGWSRGVTTI